VSKYSSESLVADARLRLDALPRGVGLLVVEGSEDRRIFSHILPLELIVAAGHKPLLLDAHALLDASEHSKVAFVVDCDYDVPAGRLHGSSNLIITEYPGVETDMVSLGAFLPVTRELLPAFGSSDRALSQVARRIMSKAISLAEQVGRIRHAAATLGEPLRFDRLQMERFWKRHRQPDPEEMVRLLVDQSEGLRATRDEILQAAREAPTGLIVCAGHDLVRALQAVLHQDYAVSIQRTRMLPEMLRLASADLISQWKVIERLRRWQEASGAYLELTTDPLGGGG